MTSYLGNIWNAIQGKPSEYFSDAPANPVAAVASVANDVVTGTTSSQSPVASLGFGAFGIIVFILFTLLPFFIFAYGSAKLSWCLNRSYGWSILCFFFPGVYYPFYAFFLNPLCNVPMIGGKRRIH